MALKMAIKEMMNEDDLHNVEELLGTPLTPRDDGGAHGHVHERSYVDDVVVNHVRTPSLSKYVCV